MNIWELMMIVCFGVSWPFNLARSIRARTAKGKSLVFLLAVLIGYVFGIVNKLLQMTRTGAFDYVLLAYLLNFLLVSADLIVYFINRRHDAARAA